MECDRKGEIDDFDSYINQSPKKHRGMTTIMSLILYVLHYTPSI